MPSPVTLRVDKETRQRIARIARRKQVSASEVIRQAIETWIEEQEPTGSPYEMVSDLIGIVHGGNRKRSAGAGRQVPGLLKSPRNDRPLPPRGFRFRRGQRSAEHTTELPA